MILETHYFGCFLELTVVVENVKKNGFKYVNSSFN